MKTYKNLYKNLLNKEFIKDYLLEVTKDKPYKSQVEKNIELITDRTYQGLVTKEINMLPTAVKVVHDRKKDRNITLSRFFPNKAYDYLLVSQIKPIIVKSMYHWCVGNVNGRGLDVCLKHNQGLIKEYSYCLQLDIKKYYESIDKSILYQLLEKKISDKDFMYFYSKVIGKKGKGIVLGLNSSQWLSNYYLQGFDYYVKQELKVEGYNRYVDNIWIYGNNLKKMHYLYQKVKKYLWEKLRLTLKENHQILNLIKGDEVDCVGYRVSKSFTRLNKQSLYKISRLYWRMKDHSRRRARTLVSLYGWLKRTTNYVKFLFTKLVSKVGISLDEIKQLTRRKKLCKTSKQLLVSNS